MNETFSVPESVGRYRIEGVLGEGAMAVVYAGFDPEIERKVAIKCLHHDVAADQEYRQRFLSEARAAGHLTHPHIVTIYDTGETEDGRPYIAMEQLSGETLASRVAREGLPSVPIIINLAGQIADALDYAHKHGIVHQDIKPENIMFVGGWQHAKVSDFGIADLRRADDDAHGRQAQVGGTPAYMALERLRGEPGDARSDLFSLGVVMYWLLTGRLPWPESEDVQELILDRKRTPRPIIEPGDPVAPSILIAIVRTLLVSAPESRYQSGAEVIGDLRLARREYERLHEKPLASRIISLRLRWAGILGMILTLVLLIGLAAIYTKQNTAVTGLARDFGISLGHMVANESAENLLVDDKAATRALVQDISRNEQIQYLAIADRYGQVIASTRQKQVGHHLETPDADITLSRPDGVDSYHSLAGNHPDLGDMLMFDIPIHYQTKDLGELRLGVSYAPLRAAQRTTLWVITMVLVVTLIAVIGAAFWLFRRPLALLDLLCDALLQVARGDYSYRIRLERRDEVGKLFNAFNLMNARLNARQRRREKSPPPPVPAEDAMQPTIIMPIRPEDEVN